MTREALFRRIEQRPLILDGATGSNLQKAGMPAGVCPELWILDHPEVLIDLQKHFVEAGTDILYAPTFSANRIKLEEYGIRDRIKEINQRLVGLSKEAAGDRALVAGDLTMTGISLAPIGTMTFERLVDIYKEQAGYQLEAGVDLFVVETMMSLAETRAAVIAIKEICDLPVMASMTYQEDGKTLYGTDPVTAVVVLQSLGADVIGVNCSTGPAQMRTIVESMKEYANVPILVKPNAGLPVLQGEVTVYPMEAEEFASYGPALVEAGAGLIGGCCGTTPSHIRLLRQAVEGLKPTAPENKHPMVIASERKCQEISLEGPFLVIGERINPTGKKRLKQELKDGLFDLVEEMAVSQEEMGAHILDVNMGTEGIDEKQMMLQAIERLSMVTSLPLCIDTSSVEVMEAALRSYPGRALINSISLEKHKIDALLPLVKKYGAMFILLPLSDKGLPESLEEKKQIIRKILEESEKIGIQKDQVLVDGLVTTVGANKQAALETLETIRYCKHSLGLCTTAGLSNISFGLPERPFVNGAFVSMAIAAGLSCAIANPSNALLMGLAFASDLLQNKEDADNHYIRQIERMGPVSQNMTKAEKNPAVNTKKEQNPPVFEAVLKGNRDRITEIVDLELAKGTTPSCILETMLIPAINQVGELFEQQKYFLPQLISGAQTMEKAVAHLEPMMQAGKDKKELPPIVIATVEGDIHDIGKNLVALMLRNYGYPVYDLGKDVPAETIMAAAKEHKAAVIALSALMTTTMMRMKDTVNLRNQENSDVKIIIGGAVTTQEFADEIGADGYSADAAGAVRLVEKILGQLEEQE